MPAGDVGTISISARSFNTAGQYCPLCILNSDHQEANVNKQSPGIFHSAASYGETQPQIYEDHGIMWNQPMANNGVMVGRDVQLLIDLEADLAPE